jgi:hypothetical protein
MELAEIGDQLPQELRAASWPCRAISPFFIGEVNMAATMWVIGGLAAA